MTMNCFLLDAPKTSFQLLQKFQRFHPLKSTYGILFGRPAGLASSKPLTGRSQDAEKQAESCFERLSTNGFCESFQPFTVRPELVEGLQESFSPPC
jgi:hypothetical protein